MSGAPPVYSPVIPEPPKFNDSRFMIFAMMRGSLVYDTEMAGRIAEVYLSAYYGIDELEKQRPLIATDAGDCWRVEGSWNQDGKHPGQTWFFIIIWKYDGRILDLGIYPHLPFDAQAVKLFREGRIESVDEFIDIATKHWPKEEDPA